MFKLSLMDKSKISSLIFRELPKELPLPASYLGSGWEHWKTYDALKNLNPQGEFTLVSYDMHLDGTIGKRRNKGITCGNWIDFVLDDFPECSAVVYGCSENATVLEGRLKVVYYKDISKVNILDYCSKRVYQSVDIDVLNTKMKLGLREWNVGSMSIEALLGAINSVNSQRTCIGIDVCGHSTTTGKVDKATLSAILSILNSITNN